MGSSVILPQPGQPATGPDPNFTQGAIPNLVQFRFQKVDPPSALYIQRDDVLVFEGASQSANDVVTITARLLLPFAQAPGQPDAPPAAGVAGGPIVGPGYVTVIQRQLALTASLTLFSLPIPLTEGYLLSAAANSANAAERGQTFVRAWVNRAAVVLISPSAPFYLFSDYVTQSQQASWPSGRLVPPTDGDGFISTYAVGNPAAGSDLSFTAHSPGRVRLATFTAKLVTSATVANRFPSFQVIDSSTDVLFTVQDTVAVPASTTVTYSLAPGGTNVRGGGAPIFVTMPLPSPFIGVPTLSVKSVTQGIAAGDQWSAIFAGTEEWLDLF